jgi:DNA (cytosine-5)-methyltransferase 1
MAEAGAVLQEYALLDAQHFGIPQRRRRVFLVACFDPATARNCPDPLLPVSESLRGDSKKGKSKGKVASRTLTEGVTDDGAIVNAIGASIYHKSTVVNQDVNSGHLVVGSLAARDYKGVGSQYVDEGKVIVEPFVKSRRAQSASDVETWVEGQVNPTLNSFDMGDTRATTTIVEPVLFENSYRDGARIAKDGVTQTLSAKMGTGGGNTPMIATAYSVREDAKANTFSATELDHANALSALRPSPQSHHAQMFIAEPQMAVRRLTPLECERLMGWPDDHTRWKADGTEQADTHRYKQCGNGVASPVAKWIAQHILKAHQ